MQAVLLEIVETDASNVTEIKFLVEREQWRWESTGASSSDYLEQSRGVLLNGVVGDRLMDAVVRSQKIVQRTQDHFQFLAHRQNPLPLHALARRHHSRTFLVNFPSSDTS
jgi:hypothetical protein